MDETYERQLADIVARLPRRPCVVALVPTIPLDQAAALASDVAQSIGAAQPGHTILTSFEESPARLDHEIGVEDEHGLTDVLSRRAMMAEVSAHGKARRFIYVPVGASGAAGESLLRSPAWRALSRSALRGGGSVLAFVPSDVFDATLRASRNGSSEFGSLFDALIWLGPPTGAGQEIRDTASASGALDLGSVQLPGPSPPRAADATIDVPTAAAPTATKSPASNGIRTREGRPGGPHLGIITAGSGRLRRRPKAQRQAKRTGLFLLLILMGILGAAAVYFVASSPFDRGTSTATPRATAR